MKTVARRGDGTNELHSMAEKKSEAWQVWISVRVDMTKLVKLKLMWSVFCNIAQISNFGGQKESIISKKSKSFTQKFEARSKNCISQAELRIPHNYKMSFLLQDRPIRSSSFSGNIPLSFVQIDFIALPPGPVVQILINLSWELKIYYRYSTCFTIPAI